MASRIRGVRECRVLLPLDGGYAEMEPLQDIQWLIDFMKEEIVKNPQPSMCNYYATAVRLKHLIISGKEPENETGFNPDDVLSP